MPVLRRCLTPRRLRYAWFVGGALWMAWLISIVGGQGLLDLAGTPIGTDYLQFYAAGTTVRTGNGAELYDIPYQMALEEEIIGPGLSTYHAFITPPFLAWLYAPLSVLTYSWSFILWSILGLVCMWLSLHLIGVTNTPMAFLWSLTFFPVFAAISFGQNSLLTLLIFSATYRLWRSRRGFWAGLVLSLALYKPQLAVGVAFLWLLDVRTSWGALLGLALGGLALVAVSFGLTPEAGLAYLAFARSTLPDLPTWEEFPIWHLHTVRGFWRLLLPWWPRVGDFFTIVLSGGAVWAFVWYWRRNRSRLLLLYAAGVVLGLCVTPHAMIYDWSLLLVPAFLAAEACPDLSERWRVARALVWMVVLVSGPLTFAQLRFLPTAVQLSVPVLLWAVFHISQDLAVAECDGSEPE